MAPSLFTLLVLTVAASEKLAVMPMVSGQEVDSQTASAVTDAAVAELRRRPDLQLVTPREINDLLSLEKQKAAFGCQSESCFAEIGGALGVGRMVVGDLAHLGQSWLVQLKVLDVAKVRVAAQVHRRIKGGTIDDVLDALPDMVTELLSGAGIQAAVASPPTRAAPTRASPAAPPPPAPAAAPPPPSWADEPLQLAQEARAALRLFTDGKGQYVAAGDDLEGPLLAGDRKRLYSQRIIGGGRDPSKLDLVFWEPRARVSAEAAFVVNEGKASLVCGQRTFPLSRVPAAEAASILGHAELLQPRWRRYGHALARDDDGQYYYVDGARDASGSPARDRDYRVFVGPKGKLAPRAVSDAIADPGGEVFLVAGGKLRFFKESNQSSAEWSDGNGRVKLTPLDIYVSAPLIYGTLGVYRGERLGSLCDGRFPER